MIYLIILLGLFFLTYVYDYRQFSRGRIVWLVVVLIVFILLGGLRYRIGTDTVNYIFDYRLVPPLDKLTSSYFSTTRYAVGYVVMTSFFKMFTNDFTAVQLFHAFVVNSVVGWFFYKNSRHVFFSLLLFFVLIYSLLVFQQMRESLAVSFFLLAWPAFRDEKWIKWYILSCCAVMFHVSAGMMFVLPIFKLPVIRNLFVFGRRTWIIGLGVLVLGVFIQSVFFKYIQLFAVSDAIADRAAVYSVNRLSGSLLAVWGGAGIIFNFLRYLVYPGLALICLIRTQQMKGDKLDENSKKMEFMALMSMYVALFTVGVAIWARYNNYFFFFSIIFISNWVYSNIYMFGKWIRIRAVYWWMFFVPLLGLHFYVSYWGSVNKSGTLKSYMSYYPYSSWFDKTRDKDRENCYSYQKTLGH